MEELEEEVAEVEAAAGWRTARLRARRHPHRRLGLPAAGLLRGGLVFDLEGGHVAVPIATARRRRVSATSTRAASHAVGWAAWRRA